MFEFFIDVIRDATLEANGIDSQKARLQREQKKLDKKKKKYIFSGKMKVLIFVVGILYLGIGVLNLVTLKSAGGLDFLSVLRIILLSALDIACLVCLGSRKKKGEVIALILIIVFVLAQYISLVLI